MPNKLSRVVFCKHKVTAFNCLSFFIVNLMSCGVFFFSLKTGFVQIVRTWAVTRLTTVQQKASCPSAAAAIVTVIVPPTGRQTSHPRLHLRHSRPPAVQSAITCPSQSRAIVFASPARLPEIQVLSFAEMCQSWPIAFKNTLVAIILLTGGTGSVSSQKLAWVVQWVVSPACEVSWFYVQPKYFLALFIPHFLSM